MNRTEQLERQVAVLREGPLTVNETSDNLDTIRATTKAWEERDRIAAEPVEATDAEVIDGWLADKWHALYVEDLQSRDPIQRVSSLAELAAWVREQGGAKR